VIYTIIYNALHLTVLLAVTVWIAIPTSILISGLLYRIDYGTPWSETWEAAKRMLTTPLMKTLE
jgi:hypothetical protein